MFPVVNSNYQPFVCPDREQSYTLTGQSLDGRRHYYRINESQFSFAERIKKFAAALFQTALTLGLALAFATVRSQWREALWNKREVIILGSSEGLLFPRHFSGSYLSAFPPYFDEQSVTLNLSNAKISHLPDNIGSLSNLNYLDLNMNLLQTLPHSLSNLSNLRSLWLANNQIQTIPECLYRLPSSCLVNLGGNPLSRQTLEQLRAKVQAEDYQGPQFTFLIYEEQSSELAAILPDWCEANCRQSLMERLSLNQQNNLVNWLERLKETVDYKNQARAIKNRVKELLVWLTEEKDGGNLQLAHQILEDATSSCEDRVALSFNHLSLHMRICQSEKLGLEELRDLIISVDRYDKLNKIATQKCQQQRMPDPIEVHLYYEARLKKVFDLPIEVGKMKYAWFSGITEEDIEDAGLQILEETGPDQQLGILLRHPIWKKFLENIPGFTRIKEVCEQQKEEALSQIDTADASAAERFYQEFQEKDKTIWDPFYVFTKQILENNPP